MDIISFILLMLLQIQHTDSVELSASTTEAVAICVVALEQSQATSTKLVVQDTVYDNYTSFGGNWRD